MKQVCELEALIPFNLGEAVGEPVEIKTTHQCAFVSQGWRAPRMRPNVEHSTARIIAATVFDIPGLSARKEHEEFLTRIWEVRAILRNRHERLSFLWAYAHNGQWWSSAWSMNGI